MQLRYYGKSVQSLFQTKNHIRRVLSHFQLNCDVNCCCDIDCADEFLRAFECDLGVELDDYHHGEGLERCEINNGMFCIFKDNLDAPNYDVS